MKTRNWSIRSKIIALTTVPLVAFLVLWIFATSLTAGPAFTLLHAQTLVNKVANPGIDLVTQLQRERLVSVEYLSGGGTLPKTLTDQRTATDRAAAQFRSTAGSQAVRNAASPAERSRLTQIFTQLGSIGVARGQVDRRVIDAIGAQRFYNQVIANAFEVFQAAAAFGDESIDREIRAVTTVGNGEEYLGRVDSLVAGATASGSLTDGMRSELLQDVGTARYLLAQGTDDMTADERTQWVELSSSAGYQQLDKMLDQLVDDSRVGAAPPVPSSAFRPTYVAVGAQVRDFSHRATASLTERATPIAVRVLVKLAAAAVLGLLALAFAIVLSVRIGRSIVGRLLRLRAEAQEMADQRLPSVVRRLQRGEPVDVEAEAPPLAYGLDEIGQLGNAFTDVQRTAVETAVEEANVRRGINEVFLNIARRSQTLLHRQLALLDKMEHRETEPDELEDLYRVDHLATRMRRHAEDLVILAGAAPGRGWRNPVPVIDVVRGAISEVEDYKRVDIGMIAPSAVLGRAVGDVIHLLAELLENAASFSPPDTRVQVSGQVLPSGYTIEIEDRGLGMPPEALAEVNRRLAEPPDFDPSDSARLGLFVVAQLAGRHGIRVSLRASAYAGITATVLVPAGLIVVVPGLAALPGGAATRGRTGEHPLIVAAPAAVLPAVPAAADPPAAEPVVHGRPVALNGAANGLGGPSPSAVAPQLNADGLVQRRRRTRPAEVDPLSALAPAADPAPAPPRPPMNGADAPTVIIPAVGRPIPARHIPAPRGGEQADHALSARAPSRPEPPAPPEPSEPPAPVTPETAAAPEPAPPGLEEGLPRRVRQASLAPQLRNRPQPEDEAVPVRSPEQIRSIMSALQQGTTRGRQDAAKMEPIDLTNRENDPAIPRVDRGEPGNEGSPRHISFADAATVSFPALGTDSADADSGETRGSTKDKDAQ